MKNDEIRKFALNVQEFILQFYDMKATDMYPDLQCLMARVFANKIYTDLNNENDMAMRQRVQNLCFKYVKKNVSRLSYILNGLEMYEIFGIVKDDDRK